MNTISSDLFHKIRSRFKGLKLGKETGEITVVPEEARFFDFDYMDGGNPIGHISISLAEPGSMKVYYSTGITETMGVMEKSHWYDFLKELREFAKRRLMSFDTRDIAKDNLDQRDFNFLSKNAQAKTNAVGESIMSEGSLYGTNKTSFQKLMDTKLIIKHSKQVDETQPGSRARNISALFVENQDGERFKYPFVHLGGARAMQRHVANGGLPYDDIGKSIISMSEQIAQLKSFSNYVVRNDLMNSDTNNIVERSGIALANLREQIARLAKQKYYEEYKSNFQLGEQEDIPEEVVEEYTEKFTVRNFKEDIKSVFPILYRLMKEQDASSEIGYNDIVEMTTIEQEEPTEREQESRDPFDQFESWVMGLGETSSITSDDDEERSQAVKELQELVGQHFPAGVDGTNAIQSLKGIIEDPELFKQIKDAAKDDADTCVRPIVKAWLEQNAPEVVGELDFGDMTEEPAPEDPMQYANDSADADAADYHSKEDIEDTSEGDNPYGAKKRDIPAYQRKQKGGDWKLSQKDLDDEESRSPTSKKGLERLKQKLDIKEVAGFIHSFYDRNTGTFPKGPEGVCTMVGKKFGEQAEQVARKFVERMAPQQATNQNPELQELSAETNEGWGADEVTRYQSGYTVWHKKQTARPGEPEFWVYKTPDGVDSDADASDAIKNQEPIAKVGSLNMAFDAMKKDGQSSKESMELEAIRKLSGISQGMGF